MSGRGDAGAGWKLMLRVLARLPQPALSRMTGRLADVRIPRPLRRPLLGAFARITGIDASEAVLPLAEYPTLDAFFVRRLRDGLRHWPPGERDIGSPVDGIFGECGRVDDGRLLQAKGRRYTVGELLADDTAAPRFRNGTFVTLYLSPRHYHRIHAPAGGRVTELRRVPGALLPVNRPAVENIERLFPRNERAVCMIDGPAGPIAVVAVGAFNVGRITASFGVGGRGVGRQITNFPDRDPRASRFDPAVPIERGDEIMAFHLGSTVVLLFEADRVVLDDSVEPGKEVRLGTRIGAFIGSGEAADPGANDGAGSGSGAP
jgi:phosphatidylserine decarboxylase